MKASDVKVIGELTEKEIENYIAYLECHQKRKLDSLEIRVDGDYVDLDYTFVPVPFERIRRITGYLVGTLDKWNDAKASEAHDRVKHEVDKEGLIEDISDWAGK